MKMNYFKFSLGAVLAINTIYRNIGSVTQGNNLSLSWTPMGSFELSPAEKETISNHEKEILENQKIISHNKLFLTRTSKKEMKGQAEKLFTFFFHGMGKGSLELSKLIPADGSLNVTIRLRMDGQIKYSNPDFGKVKPFTYEDIKVINSTGTSLNLQMIERNARVNFEIILPENNDNDPLTITPGFLKTLEQLTEQNRLISYPPSHNTSPPRDLSPYIMQGLARDPINGGAPRNGVIDVYLQKNDMLSEEYSQNFYGKLQLSDLNSHAGLVLNANKPIKPFIMVHEVAHIAGGKHTDEVPLQDPGFLADPTFFALANNLIGSVLIREHNVLALRNKLTRSFPDFKGSLNYDFTNHNKFGEFEILMFKVLQNRANRNQYLEEFTKKFIELMQVPLQPAKVKASNAIHKARKRNEKLQQEVDAIQQNNEELNTIAKAAPSQRAKGVLTNQLVSQISWALIPYALEAMRKNPSSEAINKALEFAIPLIANSFQTAFLIHQPNTDIHLPVNAATISLSAGASFIGQKHIASTLNYLGSDTLELVLNVMTGKPNQHNYENVVAALKTKSFADALAGALTIAIQIAKIIQTKIREAQEKNRNARHDEENDKTRKTSAPENTSSSSIPSVPMAISTQEENSKPEEKYEDQQALVETVKQTSQALPTAQSLTISSFFSEVGSRLAENIARDFREPYQNLKSTAQRLQIARSTSQQPELNEDQQSELNPEEVISVPWQRDPNWEVEVNKIDQLLENNIIEPENVNDGHLFSQGGQDFFIGTNKKTGTMYGARYDNHSEYPQVYALPSTLQVNVPMDLNTGDVMNFRAGSIFIIYAPAPPEFRFSKTSGVKIGETKEDKSIKKWQARTGNQLFRLSPQSTGPLSVRRQGDADAQGAGHLIITTPHPDTAEPVHVLLTINEFIGKIITGTTFSTLAHANPATSMEIRLHGREQMLTRSTSKSKSFFKSRS